MSPAFGFDYADARVRVYGSGNQPVSWISYADVAKFAVASLYNPAARNGGLQIGDPGMSWEL